MRNKLWTIALLLAPALGHAQLFTLTKEQLIELTKQNTFDRFPDGRPKIPDSLLERATGVWAEEAWAGLNQFGGGAPGGPNPRRRGAGRALPVQFMPARPDRDSYLNLMAQAKGMTRFYNQSAIDMLQPG